MADNELWEQAGKESRRARRRRAWVYAMVAGLVIILGVFILVLNLAGIKEVDIPGDALSENLELEVIFIDEGTWDDIMAVVDPRVQYLIPKDMPMQYEFEDGDYFQPDNEIINMGFNFRDTTNDKYLKIKYVYFSENADVASDISILMKNAEIHTEDWNGVMVDYVENGERTNMMWYSDRCRIIIFSASWLDRDQMQEIFRCIMKVEP